MHSVTPTEPSGEPAPDREQKMAALSYLNEAWAEARLDGIDNDCMAMACLFAAFAELVTTYGEDAAAKYADTLSKRILNGEFTIEIARQ
jgi:predicted YcjX-like family ATPase